MSTLLASSVAAGACGLLLLAAPCNAQTASQQQTTMAQTESPAAIRPFRVNVAEEALVDAFKPLGDGPEFVNACHARHTIVRNSDFVFTKYAPR